MIGKNIKKYRLAKGISLTELAERSGVSKSYLNSLERNIKNNPSINVINRLADVLETDLNDILGAEATGDVHPNDLEGWQRFIEEAKKAGIEQAHLSEYKEVIAYIKWKNRQDKS
ncbi:helix-turn-helix transcriptional regulator [Alkalihalobacillus hwajinpoensis]|uniref:helix-turn-helix domain-containing protein n=1 Tax=Guptibacillus hwajinpoensis TaxID=208199 RepID=UPI001883E108|nr:helix-turn-helix transcriptional regulator [Pseudalkalibacillus hwajinpoensis]MBF0705411.1 helix-turn-helix transcriptional regulator [Pseudalkalibacillus hwajinpoensis]